MHIPYHSYYADINKIQKYIKTHPCYSHNRTIILPIREMFRSTKIHQNPPIKIALLSTELTRIFNKTKRSSSTPTWSSLGINGIRQVVVSRNRGYPCNARLLNINVETAGHQYCKGISQLGEEGKESGGSYVRKRASFCSSKR